MKRVLLAAIALIVAGALAAPSVFAQSSALSKVKKKKLKKYDFTGDDIEATTVRPDGEDMNVVPFATHENLVKIRRSFQKEIIREAEDI